LDPFTSPESHSFVPSSAERVVGPSHLWQADGMKARLNMIYWKSDKFWLGRLVEHPEIMTQGRTLKELEENIRDAYQLMVLEDVPDDYAVKQVEV
jgi:predicted RNase H-like HicB family nuclease